MDQVFNEYVAALTKDAFFQAFQYGAGQPLVFPFCNWCKIGVIHLHNRFSLCLLLHPENPETRINAKRNAPVGELPKRFEGSINN